MTLMRDPAADSAVIRPAILADAEALRQFKRQALVETEFLLQGLEDFDDRVDHERDLIGRFLQQPNCLLLVAAMGGRVVGICSIVGGHLLRTKHVGVMSVAVLRRFWRQGLGVRLMRAAIEWADRNPVLLKLSLQVHASNAAARAMYQRLGFAEEGRLHGEARLQQGFDDLIPMGLILHGKRALSRPTD